jgi:hypothetical protein
MNQQLDDCTQTRQLYEAGDFESSGRLYHELWDERGDAFSDGRYVYRPCKVEHA